MAKLPISVQFDEEAIYKRSLLPWSTCAVKLTLRRSPLPYLKSRPIGRVTIDVTECQIFYVSLWKTDSNE